MRTQLHVRVVLNEPVFTITDIASIRSGTTGRVSCIGISRYSFLMHASTAERRFDYAERYAHRRFTNMLLVTSAPGSYLAAVANAYETG